MHPAGTSHPANHAPLRGSGAHITKASVFRAGHFGCLLCSCLPELKLSEACLLFGRWRGGACRQPRGRKYAVATLGTQGDAVCECGVCCAAVGRTTRRVFDPPRNHPLERKKLSPIHSGYSLYLNRAPSGTTVRKEHHSGKPVTLETKERTIIKWACVPAIGYCHLQSMRERRVGLFGEKELHRPLGNSRSEGEQYVVGLSRIGASYGSAARASLFTR